MATDDQSLPVPAPVRIMGTAQPDRLYIKTPGLTREQTAVMAHEAATMARKLCPKLSGRAANGITSYYDDGFFGVKWSAPYLWDVEKGTKARTMLGLANKTIPMWISDPTGSEHRKNPKAKTRLTVDGRKQILIFRKAAKIGARKRVAVRDGQGRLVSWRETAASYPGAPGRISHRGFHDVTGPTGRIFRLTSRPHVGVRWRHPGIVGREFMQHSLQSVGMAYDLLDVQVYAVYRRQ